MSYLAFIRTCVVVIAGILGAGPATAGVFLSEDASHARSLPAELTHSTATAASALIIDLQRLAPTQDMEPTGSGALIAVVGRPHGPQFFVARFGGGVLSDKVPVVPETPYTALIAGVMLLALRLRARLALGRDQRFGEINAIRF